MGRPEQERKERMTELEHFAKLNPTLWNNPLHRRQIIVSFARKWGLRTITVVDYAQQLAQEK